MQYPPAAMYHPHGHFYYYYFLILFRKEQFINKTDNFTSAMIQFCDLICEGILRPIIIYELYISKMRS